MKFQMIFIFLFSEDYYYKKTLQLTMYSKIVWATHFIDEYL